MSTAGKVVRILKQLYEVVVDPLRVDDDTEHFTLSIPDAQTTTVDSVQGWSNRPAARLRCPGCGTEIFQRRASSDIDCTNCYRVFKPDEFAELELLALVCPRCVTDMDHGVRHPNLFDNPEWATCPDCQYHWDLSHWFRLKRR